MNLWPTVRMLISALRKPRQRIPVHDLPAGRVIDIGGGGEGIIAQAGGARVVAIDRLVSEIREAQPKAPDVPWLVADATRLPCVNHSFDSATAFFSGMYMPEGVKAGTFREARRVLKPGGELWVWDVSMAQERKVFAIRLQVALPNGHTVNTAYGVRAKDQSAASICGMLQQAGFEPQVVTDTKLWFLIKARAV